MDVPAGRVAGAAGAIHPERRHLTAETFCRTDETYRDVWDNPALV
jgi:hypothetical protein